MRFCKLIVLASVSVIMMIALSHWNYFPAQPPEKSKDDDKKTPEKKPPPKIEPLDEDILRRAKLKPDGDALLEFFQKRILPEKDRPEIERLVQRLSSPAFTAREHASTT